MRRFLAALAALALGFLTPARAEAVQTPGAFDQVVGDLSERAENSAKPREELEHLSLLAALSMVHILELEGRYQPFPPGPNGGEHAQGERWLYAGERVAIVREDEFPEYFAIERTQRELGLFVGADDEELDRRLSGWRVPRALLRGAERLAERARLAG